MEGDIFFKNSIDAMLVIENDVIIDCNRAAVAMLGYDCEEEVIDRTPADFSPEFQPDGRASEEKAEEVIQLAREQRSLRFEWDHMRRNGEVFPVEVSIVAVVEGERVMLHTVWRDITERKRAEETLKESEERFRSIFDASNEALFIHDPETGSVLDVNRKMCEMYGVSREEALGFDVGIFSADVPPYTKKEALEWIHKASAGEPQLFEWHAKNRDGRLFWVEVNMRLATIGSEERLIVSVRDIAERKQAEEALFRSEERFRGMFKNMSSGVAIYEAVDEGADFVFMDFNPAGERIEKVSREDVVGKRLGEGFPWSVKAGLSKVFRRVWRTGVAEQVLFSIQGNGQDSRWRNNHVYRLPSGELVAVFDDLTAQRKAERALQESEEKYRLLATNSLDMIWTSDLNHKFTFVNDAIQRLAGYTPAEYMAMEVLEYTPTESIEKILPVANELVEESKRGVFRQKKIEVKIRHKNGGLVDVEVTVNPLLDSEGTMIGFQGRTVDITERKRIEQDRERFMAAIDQAAETIVITDIEGLIQYVNPAFERITGYGREEAVGLNPNVLKSGEHDESFYAEMWATILRGDIWRGIFVNQKKDGTTYTEEATISPVKDRSGTIVNFVAIKMDITEELAREEQYRQSQKMESVGRLASGVAHDFNNILQTITGFCGLILAEMDERSPHRADVLEIQTAVKHAGELTRQLLEFSRKRSTDYQTVDLNTVLSEGQKMLCQALGDEHQLQFQLGSPIHPVRADAIQILQIAMNLIVNARDATPEGGEIVLATENVEIPEDQPAFMSNARKGLFVCLSVADAGCGMDERQLSHVFEPFFSTKQPGQGTGLGLSVVYGIVKEHGGWIHVESEPDQGSVFKIYLPKCEKGRMDAGEGNGRVDLPGRKILLVEDEAMVRELACEILQNVGYDVSVAESTTAAQTIFASAKGGYDLLFSDIFLPDGNGIELAESLRRQQPDLPVLLFSGYSDERVRPDVIREKGFGYMRKPFNLETLLDLVALTLATRK